jgi:SAM-dependent methyltransferase
MPDIESLHQQRQRAESFGAAAADYDRYRPSYPEPLIDELAAPRPRGVLDIGCGTGKAARLLAARGLDVLGVEIDPKMAAVAQSHGVRVEVAGFEEWDPLGRTFDLIICAQAWHWVDPAVGAPKAAALLRPGGAMALFWNYEEIAADSRAIVDGVYRELAPELLHEAANNPDDRADDLRRTGAFGVVTTQTFEWQRTLSAADWVGKVATQSNHLVLGRQRLAVVGARLSAALDAAGGQVHMSGGTYTIWARPGS